MEVLIRVAMMADDAVNATSVRSSTMARVVGPWFGGNPPGTNSL
jgi:hypothetical protein